MKKTNDSQDDNVSSSGKIVSVLLAVTALYAALRIGFGISSIVNAPKDNDVSSGTTEAISSLPDSSGETTTETEKNDTSFVDTVTTVVTKKSIQPVLVDNSADTVNNEDARAVFDPTDFSLSANIVNGGLAAFDEKYVYLSNDNLIKRDIFTGEETILLKKKVYYINIDSDYLYFKTSDNHVYKIDKYGGNLVKLLDYYVHELTVYNGKLYFCSNMGTEEYGIYSMNTDGTDIRKIADVNAWYMNIYKDNIYYTDYNNRRKLMKMDLNGKNRECLCEKRCFNVCVIDDMIYFSTGDGRKLYRMTANGTQKEKILDSYTNYTNYYNSRFYFIDDNNIIYSCKTDGTDLKQLSDNDLYSFINCSNIGLFALKGTDKSLVKIDYNDMQ